ncbi:DUF2470 domain-containing protein [Streptomyces litchfieldiae]|uniref:DUF2470 domain-containing protein n=1 Tax=Streptomyces litchfieldiae TaxID=3075543 RepID=A0ABU2MPZ5_9ACTN|nr:DUF2470 domain-containing protein [Streptomyces sp. DSM 44938]MDT0343701.1 DUF2470 domain-containing protein [Streptomyces sp. DSM 44938]
MIRPGSPVPGTGHRSQEGQPRPGEDARQPTAAERVRTLLDGNASATLVIPGAEPEEPGTGAADFRVVAPSGDVFVLVPAGARAAVIAARALDDEVTAVMEITDVAPVAVPHRIRGRGWVAGWLTTAAGGERTAALGLLAERYPGGAPWRDGLPDLAPDPNWALLRLEVGEAYTDDLWGADHVEPDELAEAAADPLARHEAELLQHLAAAHQPQLRSLSSLLGERGAGCAVPPAPGGGSPEQGGAGWHAVTPLSLDRFGLRVRFRAGPACFDARFEFPEPVGDIAQLRRAMRQLFEAAGA